MNNDDVKAAMERPEGTDVHVWKLFHEALKPPPVIPESSILSDQELERQARFVTRELQFKFMCRREMIRRVLTLYRPDIGESEWMFTHNEQGKPQIHTLQCKKNLYFNLSHTDGLTVLAISGIEQSGIDVENTAIEEPRSYLDIAERFFTPAETASIRQGSNTDQIQRFFDFWTLKEAFIKAVGRGLSLGLDRFQFILDTKPAIRVEILSSEIDQDENWVFHQETIAERYRIAIAVKASTGKQITLKCINFAKFL